jgi:hypothetical protein
VSHRKLHWTRWGKTWRVSVRKPSDPEGFLKGIIENGSEWCERARLREGNAMGRCLRCVLSLRFECALDFDGVGVTSSRQVFPHLSLRRQWNFLWDTHQWFFKFLVIFIARVISSVYCSMVFVSATSRLSQLLHQCYNYDPEMVIWAGSVVECWICGWENRCVFRFSDFWATIPPDNGQMTQELQANQFHQTQMDQKKDEQWSWDNYLVWVGHGVLDSWPRLGAKQVSFSDEQQSGF